MPVTAASLTPAVSKPKLSVANPDLQDRHTETKIEEAPVIAGKIQMVLDAIFRGAVRTAETAAPWLRFGRPLTEFVRYFGIGSINKVISKEKVTRTDSARSIRRALENSLATVVIEPNNFNSRVARIFVGFLNNLVRFTVRVALVFFNFVSPEEVNISDLMEESLSRAFPRALFLDTSNPLFGTAVRTGEQIFINLGLRLKPAEKLVNKLRSSFYKS